MLAEKKRNTNIGVGLGLLTQIVGNVLQAQGGAASLLGLLIILAGTGIFIWGCVQYCQGKGHSGWLGLLGLLSILGLLVLIFLPDRCKDGRYPQRYVAIAPPASPPSGPGMFDTRKK